MRRRFIKLWKRLGKLENSEIEYNKILTRYLEPQRFYHRIKHINNCLREFDSAKHLAEERDLVEVGIWYHDAIYDPQAKDNEEKSAQLAYNICLTAKLPEESSKKVKELILSTKHNVIPEGIDGKILLDIDLSIFGKSQKKFDGYESNIWKEYSWVPEDKFREGRSAILQMFLDKNSIYLTDFFKDKYEAQARINLERSIEKLR